MDEQPIVEQENDVSDSSATDRLKDPATGATAGAEPEEFDPEQFAALMQKELIAYNFSWDPLLKALQALGLSMARQQQAQKSNNHSVEDMHDTVGSLQDQLGQVQSEKSEMGATLAALKDQMDAMQAKMDKLQQQQEQLQDRDSDSNSGAGKEEGGSVSSTGQDPPLVTAKDLAKAKKDLSKQLRRSLTEAFGHEVADDHADDEDNESESHDSNSPNAEGSDGTGGAETKKTTQTSFKLPGAPFASDAVVRQELARLQQLQDALNDRLVAHDLQLESLVGKVGDLDTKSSDLETQLAQNGSEKHSTPRRTPSPANSEAPAAMTAVLLKDLSELKAVQDSHAQLLKDQHQAVGKNASDIKALVESLEDLAIQQQTSASMYVPVANQSTSGGDSQAVGGQRRSSDSGNPQLDLSLVFTKIADLRRSTDASLDSLQKNISLVSDATDSQQAQLDSLRNGLVFNEHQRLHMIESRLAMQKELLDRNQTHQDRAKPQLAEWRKALDLNEEKLTQGLCDEEILQELQQLQRHYRRTYLSFSPLINSPLTIAESLQVLAEEIKQFQNGVKAGVVPLKSSSEANSSSKTVSKKNEREEEFTKKLRYLDEEVNATLQVNVVTEKKNDPLIKSLDSMREKLESLSTMWYRNFTQRKRASRGQGGGGDLQGTMTDSDCTPRSASGDYDGLREIELRLMGAVRRLGIVEEDVERLNNVTAINASEMSSATRAAANAGNGGGSSVRSGRNESDELGKLRKELFAEIAKLTATLSNLQLSSGSHSGGHGSTALVPSQLADSRNSSHVSQNDLVKELYSQMKGRELDGRFQEMRDDEMQKQLYDNFLKEVTKKVTHAVLNADKSGGAGAGGGRLNAANGGGAGAAGNNVNYRLMLENFTQKVEDRLEDAREMTAEELLRMKKELADQLKLKIELALRELRGELMLFPTDSTGDTTAMGTKPVMCVACSRPVPVSHAIREAGSLPPAELQAEHSPPHNHSLQPDYVRISVNAVAMGYCAQLNRSVLIAVL